MTEAEEPVGRVGRAHGRDGSFYVEDARRAPEVGETLDAGGHELRVERRAGTDERPILRLAGVEDRDAAAALRGTTLRSPGSALEPAADEWRVEDLLGCRVDGLGEVRGVLAAPSCDVLEVGEERTLVPLIRDAVRRIDTSERRIEVDRRFLGLEESAEDADARRSGGA